MAGQPGQRPKRGSTAPLRSWGPLLATAGLPGVALLVFLGLELGRAPDLPAAAVEEYAAAAARGDWRGAGVIAARAAARPDDPAARVISAMDAAMAGLDAEARAILGDPDELPEPMRSRGHLLLGGLDRMLGAGGDYASAATSDARAMECTGTDCTVPHRLARRGLALSCVVLADTSATACGSAELPRWASDAERQLVRSAVLLKDGHGREARRDLAGALAAVTSSDDCGCVGLRALRLWAASAAVEPGSELHRALLAVGRSASRTPADCRLFSEQGDG